jgi:membrane-bound lytic murein transglycosylase B
MLHHSRERPLRDLDLLLLSFDELERRCARLYHREVVSSAYPVVDALFRAQRFDALTMVDRGHIDAGSWAGAMGQPQFIPSSYLAYAVDFDGDGRRDIWTSHADTFASIANYLKGHGWRGTSRGWNAMF